MAGSIDGVMSEGAGEHHRADDRSGNDDEAIVLEADIRQTQARLGDTIEEIGERFNPRRLKEEVKHDIRDATIGRVENMAHQTAEMMTGAKRILVASNDEMFGVARLYGLHQSTSQGEEPMVVRDLQDFLSARLGRRAVLPDLRRVGSLRRCSPPVRRCCGKQQRPTWISRSPPTPWRVRSRCSSGSTGGKTSGFELPA